MAGSVGSEDGDVGFQIAPMVDVVFVLMLFFMASAGSQVVEKELNINLPSGRSGPSADLPPTPIIIDISPEGQVTANNTNYGTTSDKNLTALREWLTGAIEQFGADNPVIIRPAPQTKQDRVIDVLNAAAASGVKSLSFS